MGKDEKKKKDPAALKKGNELFVLREERDDWKEKALRALADLQNFRKRAEEEKKTLSALANLGLIAQILEIVDNFDRCLQHIPAELTNNEWGEGVRQIGQQLKDFLQRNGVKEIEAEEGKQIEPQYHQVMLSDKGEEGKILEVLEKGYMLGDQIIRPAKVKVGSGG